MVKDQAVAALIDKKDTSYFYRLARKVRKEVSFANRNSLPYSGNIINELWNQCKSKFNDHAGIFEVGNKKIELEDATVTDDLPCTDGLDQCIRLIMATSSSLFRYMETGQFSGNPTAADTALFSPWSPRIDMSLLGTREPIGMTIRFLAVFGETHGANPITECGIFSASSGGSILNHNIFGANPLNRIIGQQAAIVSSVVEFCPKA